MPGKSPSKSLPPEMPSAAAQAAVGVSVQELTAIYTLDQVKGFGPAKFKALYEAGVDRAEAVRNPDAIPISGKRGDDLRAQLRRVDAAVRLKCSERAQRQIAMAHRLGAQILTYASPDYPRAVFESNNPVLPLYARGAISLLAGLKAVACVGSRNLRPPYLELHRRLAALAADVGLAVVSGFATGADIVGHEAAVAAGGSTVCCMPGGLDRPFPPENREVWARYLTSDRAVFISEFAFGTSASALTLRKRNKLIVAAALGVVISQSAEDGGAMNAYRFAREQKKPVATFRPDGTHATSGNLRIVTEATERNAVFDNDQLAKDQITSWLNGLSSST